jgi:hypothetical protein
VSCTSSTVPRPQTTRPDNLAFHTGCSVHSYRWLPSGKSFTEVAHETNSPLFRLQKPKLVYGWFPSFCSVYFGATAEHLWQKVNLKGVPGLGNHRMIRTLRSTLVGSWAKQPMQQGGGTAGGVGKTAQQVTLSHKLTPTWPQATQETLALYGCRS